MGAFARIGQCLAMGMGLCVFAVALPAQRPESRGSSSQSSPGAVRPGRGPVQVQPLTATPHLKRLFAPVVRVSSAFTARILAGSRQVALATVVATDGYLVSKASELPAGELLCELGNWRGTARRAGQDQVSDLALLRVDRDDLEAAAWNETPPPAGAWLVSPDGSELPCGIGILSSAPYEHSRQRGYLGVQMHRDPGPARIETVQPDSAAQQAGLQPEDVVLAIGGQEVSSYEKLIEAIGKHLPGTRVPLLLHRGQEDLSVDVELRPDRRGPPNSQERLWGPLSGVRSGFAAVLQHDTILRPEHCGGPLVDLEGRVVGVNIARAGRVESLALPAATVRAVVTKLRQASGVGR